MLMNLQKPGWSAGLRVHPFDTHTSRNAAVVTELKDLAVRYNKSVVEEGDQAPDKRVVANVGKMDAKKHLEARVMELMGTNVVQCMTTMLDTVVF